MSRYKLPVRGGWYQADNLFILLWEVLKHRFWHLKNHKRWVD